MENVKGTAEVPVVFDPYSVGWWVAAMDEEVYGPLSRNTLRRFLREGVVSPNTLVRHVTQSEAKPLADQSNLMAGLKLDAKASVNERLAEVWPRKWRDQQALAEGPVSCVWHKYPAISYCVRCRAPYCYKCSLKSKKKSFFFCRHCQANNHNRRFLALMGDFTLFVFAPVFGISFALPAAEEGLVTLTQLGGNVIILMRDSLFRGASPGKWLMSLHVVQLKDETLAPTFGQGILRWVSQLIPIFNLADAFAPLSDPLQRRYGDRWAGTRVIDTDAKLTKARDVVRKRMARKGVTLMSEARN